MSTIFTKIINKEIETDIIYENDHVIAFNDILPQAPIHILIIPKVEIATVNDLNEDNSNILGIMFLSAKKIADKLGIASNGYRLVMNCNDDGGQSVYHIHLHLLGGRKFNWPPG